MGRMKKCKCYRLLKPTCCSLLIITSVQKVMLSLCLFAIRIMQKLLDSFFTKFGGKVEHGPWKNPLDFGGNLEHTTLERGLRLM